MTYVITYYAPVKVVVDLDARKVTRVVVEDESVDVDPFHVDAGRVDRESDGQQVTGDLAKAVFALADASSTEWPKWTLGW